MKKIFFLAAILLSLTVCNTVFAQSYPTSVANYQFDLGTGTISAAGAASGVEITIPGYIKEATVEIYGTCSNALILKSRSEGRTDYRSAQAMKMGNGVMGSGVDCSALPEMMTVRLNGKDRLLIYGDDESPAFSGSASVIVKGQPFNSMMAGIWGTVFVEDGGAGATQESQVDLLDQAANLASHWEVTNFLGGTRAFAGVAGSLASSANTANQVVATYTVTSGKTFFLQYWNVGARLSTYAATATNFGACSLQINGASKWTVDLSNVGASDVKGQEVSPGIPVAAGLVVRIVCTPSGSTAFTFHGNLGGYEK